MPDQPEAGLVWIVGGESTGKSSLAAALGERLPAVVVAEFLRDWVRQRSRVPQPAEQAGVMAAHRASEVSALQHANRTGQSWVVSDSGPLMTAVYSLQYYDDDSLLPQALEWAAETDLVVWCQDDFPWQPDPQRDGAHARRASQEILSAIFSAHPELPVVRAAGSLSERIASMTDEARSRRVC